MTLPSHPTPVLVALATCVAFLPAVVAQELRFQHHYIARDLPVNARVRRLRPHGPRGHRPRWRFGFCVRRTGEPAVGAVLVRVPGV